MEGDNGLITEYRVLFIGENLYVKNQAVSVMLTGVKTARTKVLCSEQRLKTYEIQGRIIRLKVINTDCCDFTNETVVQLLRAVHAVVFFSNSDFTVGSKGHAVINKLMIPKFIVIHNETLENNTKLDKDIYEICLNQPASIEKFIMNSLIDLITIYDKNRGLYTEIHKIDINKLFFKYTRKKKKTSIFCCS
jgi:hypothetical protein